MTIKEVLFHLVYTICWGSMFYWIADNHPLTPSMILLGVFGLGCMALQLHYLITEAAERF